MPALGFPLSSPLDGSAPDDLNNISKLLVVLAAPIQTFEDACQQYQGQCDLDRAVGVNLDFRGNLLNEQRNGLDDDTYRRRIRARRAVQRSTSATEDLIRVARLLLNDDVAVVAVLTQVIATVIVRIENIVVSDVIATILFEFLRGATGAGVRLVLESGSSTFTGLFRFDSGPGFDIGHFADARDHL